MGHTTEQDTAAAQAREILRANSSSQGFVASADLSHYAALWTRDIAFAAMGANMSGESDLLDAVARSLVSLTRTQSTAGQIAGYHAPSQRHWDYHESGSTDATCLYVVAAADHLAARPDPDLQRRLWPHLRRACRWLASQDANGFTLIDSPMGGDWMDSTLQRSGKLLYVNVLYERALRGMAELGRTTGEQEGYARLAALVRRKLNLFFWPQADEPYEAMLDGVRSSRDGRFPHSLGRAAHAAAARGDRTFYLSHVEGERRVDECDVLGNVLAVLFDIAPPERAQRIMRYLDDGGAARPYPARSYLQPFAPGDRWGMYKQDLDPLQCERWRNPPGAYHNGGVWPFIGGLYVAALVCVGMHGTAQQAMEELTAANRLSRAGQLGFHEWIHAGTGEPCGASRQTWSAGSYLFAWHTLRAGRRLP